MPHSQSQHSGSLTHRSVYDSYTEVTCEQFAAVFGNDSGTSGDNLAALNNRVVLGSNADVTVNVTLCTLVFIRGLTSATSAMKLSHACEATRCFRRC